MLHLNRQESKKISKRRIEEIVNYLLENYQTIIKGKYAMVNGINLDLSDEDDEYISYIREDIDILNAVLKGINKKTTENLKSKISRFMNIGTTQRYNAINAFKITGLNEFPVELYNFRNLTILELIDGDINEIPQDINNLYNLLELRISNCPNISKLPDSLTRLINLMKLEISDTNISKLPEDIGNLSNLRELILKKNPNLDIDKLPESLSTNNNIIIEDDSSHFYENEMILENISNINKSTIVLAINGHGLDLCDES
jgi:Leucine-rich repeat (LRR) protein